MRIEDFWREPQNLPYYDFYMFWEEYHASDDYSDDYTTDNEDCEWRQINVNCNEFSFITDECYIEASYSPCETEYFNCVSSSVGEYGAEESDCAADFEDFDFWSAMRLEQWW